MPPKKNTTKKTKDAPTQESLQQPLSAPAQPSQTKTPPKVLRMYRSFHCSTNQPGFFTFNELYLRKIGAFQKHRIDNYSVRIEKTTDLIDKGLVFKHLSKFKRLRQISFYMGQRNINQGSRLPQQVEILKKFKRAILRYPHLAKVHFTYPNKLADLIYLRGIGHLDHITLGLDINDFLKDENKKQLIALLSRHFQYHRIKSAKLICYGTATASKRGKKGGKGKAKKGKGKGKAQEEDEDPLEYLTTEFNHLTQIQNLSVECKEQKFFKSYIEFLAEKTFPKLKSTSFLSPNGGFTIQNKSNPVLNSAVSLVQELGGKDIEYEDLPEAQKETPEIQIKNFENVLKTQMNQILPIGNLTKLVLEIAKTKPGELENLFKSVPNLKRLSLQYSPQSDDQLKEFYVGLKKLSGLDDLELYFQFYKFSKDSIDGISEAIAKHSPFLKLFCLGFNEVEHINKPSWIMDHVLAMPNLTIFRVYLGSVSSFKKTLAPLKQLSKIRRLTEFEFGGFFHSQSVRELGRFMRDALYDINTLRSLNLKVVWHYNVWDGLESKTDFTAALEGLPCLKKLNTLYIDFENNTWHKVKPK